MPAKPVFNEEQFDIIHAAALRVWKRLKADGKTQKDFALALGLTQQSISNLIKGTYRPGLKVATEIATLDGKELEDLVGDVAPPTTAPAAADAPSPGNGTYKNLDVCLQFYAATKHWSPWTVAAARAGFFGNADFAPPEWPAKLDALEKALERARGTR